MEVQRQLQKLPRRSNPNRVVRRCSLTGSLRCLQKIWISRSKLREMAMSGKLPGVKNQAGNIMTDPIADLLTRIRNAH